MSAPDYWDWRDTEQWGGNCNQHIMQSPIDIVAPVKDETGNTGNPFHINYNFEKSIPVLVKANGVDIILKFTQFSGAFKIVYRRNGDMLSYHPTHLSFRFPAEHLINGYRLDGEIILVCEEITSGDNSAYSITNGLEFVIPLQFSPFGPQFDELGDLNPEIWKTEIARSSNRSYKPRDPLTGKDTMFKLHDFFNKIMDLKSDFSMYMGTSTTPPCAGI